MVEYVSATPRSVEQFEKDYDGSAQPISTAPLDGTAILVNSGATYARVKWHNDMWVYDVPSDYIEQIDFKPKRWAPLKKD